MESTHKEETSIRTDTFSKAPTLSPAPSSFLWVVPQYLIIGLVFLLPIFFIPSPAVHFQFAKIILIAVVVTVAAGLAIVRSLREGALVFPRAFLMGAALLIPIVFFLASLSAPSAKMALMGYGFETGTWGFMTFMTLLFLITATLFRGKARFFYLYLAVLASFCVMAFFLVTRLFAGFDTLSFEILNGSTANVLGKWNELGVYFGLIAILSFLTIELVSVNQLLKIALYLILALSLFLLAVVNFTATWIILAVFALSFFIYRISFTRGGVGKESRNEESTAIPSLSSRIPVATVIVLGVSLFFVFAGAWVGDRLTTFFDIAHLEARPSWRSTISIARAALDKDLLLGVGPQHFANEWLLHKPQGINETLFWNADFDAGIGFLPTLIVTTGVLGGLTLAVMLILFLYMGFRALIVSGGDRFTYYLVLSSLVGALYLWSFAIFYVPGPVLIAYLFIFTGLYVAILVNERVIGERALAFAGNPRVGFVTSFVLILMLAGLAGGVFWYGKLFLATTYFQKAFVAARDGASLNDIEASVVKALRLSWSDQFLRLRAQISIERVRALVQESGESASSEEQKATFQNTLGSAIQDARAAVTSNESNYLNWLVLGDVYGAIVPLGIEGAYDQAAVAYREAIVRNPTSPALPLAVARLDIARGNNEEARARIADALALKNNYTEAIFLLSQIEVMEGNLEEAINSVETATLIAPDDPVIFFQLGLLHYHQKDYEKAITALERAVTLNSSYSNARYFLGLSYAERGLFSEGLEQFREIEKFNPDNQEVKTIIQNLAAERKPFAGVEVPPPEAREELPVGEE